MVSALDGHPIIPGIVIIARSRYPIASKFPDEAGRHAGWKASGRRRGWGRDDVKEKESPIMRRPRREARREPIGANPEAGTKGAEGGRAGGVGVRVDAGRDAGTSDEESRDPGARCCTPRRSARVTYRLNNAPRSREDTPSAERENDIRSKRFLPPLPRPSSDALP